MDEHRTRASGWKHAKLSGHKNESLLENSLLNNEELRSFFLKKVNKETATITHIDIGGLYETDVECVFDGEKTKSKTDMHIILDDGSKYNISIKKSLSGQVYLINANRFIKGFELQFNKIIPDNIKRAIYLFWGYDEDVLSIINSVGTKKNYEVRKHRLVADTLKIHNVDLFNSLIDWFKNNIKEITDFCFSKGLAKNQNDWANLVWYNNLLDENPVNEIYFIDELIEIISKYSEENIFYGKVGGGTTIQLPFGFVQWHSPTKKIPGDMQFHHNYHKIKELLRK